MHKINSSIDNFYKNNLKKETFQLFLIKDKWASIASPEIALYSRPYDIIGPEDKRILVIEISALALANNILYSQDKIINSICNLSNLEISKFKFITKNLYKEPPSKAGS
jgi:hypothetical protein